MKAIFMRPKMHSLQMLVTVYGISKANTRQCIEHSNLMIGARILRPEETTIMRPRIFHLLIVSLQYLAINGGTTVL
jgi:hypothetical protein